jgi:hypothetical protein
MLYSGRKFCDEDITMCRRLKISSEVSALQNFPRFAPVVWQVRNKTKFSIHASRAILFQGPCRVLGSQTYQLTRNC